MTWNGTRLPQPRHGLSALLVVLASCGVDATAQHKALAEAEMRVEAELDRTTDLATAINSPKQWLAAWNGLLQDSKVPVYFGTSGVTVGDEHYDAERLHEVPAALAARLEKHPLGVGAELTPLLAALLSSDVTRDMELTLQAEQDVKARRSYFPLKRTKIWSAKKTDKHLGNFLTDARIEAENTDLRRNPHIVFGSGDASCKTEQGYPACAGAFYDGSGLPTYLVVERVTLPGTLFNREGLATDTLLRLDAAAETRRDKRLLLSDEYTTEKRVSAIRIAAFLQHHEGPPRFLSEADNDVHDELADRMDIAKANRFEGDREKYGALSGPFATKYPVAVHFVVLGRTGGSLEKMGGRLTVSYLDGNAKRASVRREVNRQTSELLKRIGFGSYTKLRVKNSLRWLFLPGAGLVALSGEAAVVYLGALAVDYFFLDEVQTFVAIEAGIKAGETAGSILKSVWQWTGRLLSRGGPEYEIDVVFSSQ